MVEREVWRLLTRTGKRGSAAQTAREYEAQGWTGVGLPDSQTSVPDPFVEMSMAAIATSTLKLATSVTNPYTRDAAVVASAAATLQFESGGRVVLGLGRGDSSLANLGLAPAPVGVLREYLERVLALLSGSEASFRDTPVHMRSAETFGLAGRPTASRLGWIDPVNPKVPVNVAATGPKVIAMSAVLADQVTFAVGADPDRIRWAIGVARDARSAAGLDPDGLDLGVYVPIVVHEDFDTAQRMISGDVGSFARFSVMHGTVVGPSSAATAATLERVHSVYDVRKHYQSGSPASQAIDTDVIERFGIAGPAGWCVERLEQIFELGIRRVFSLRVGHGIDPDAHQQAEADFANLVLPKLV